MARSQHIKSVPDYTYESRCASPIAGVDEAGRGPWAGPVVAAAVILDIHTMPDGLNDSKKLTALKRDALFPLIMNLCHVGIGAASVAEIDQLNIRRATHLAMHRAVSKLKLKPQSLLIDGNDAPEFECNTYTLIKGDGLSLSIAAASIVAKVTRDTVMKKLSSRFSQYGWAQNKGYGTAVHQQGLIMHGPCIHHRRSFAPVRALLNAEQTESE